MLSRLLLLCVLVSLRAGAAGLTVVSPVDGETVSGTVTFSVTCDAAAVASVEYSLGSHWLGVARSAPFSLTWNSNESMDGNVAVQVVGRDRMGGLLASGERLITVANRGASFAVNGPDLAKTLSGTVSLSVTGADSPAFPAAWSFNIDGEEQYKTWTDNSWKSPIAVTARIDTTRVPNGPHELQIDMNSRSGPANPQWVNWRGMVNRVVNIDNGHAFMDVVAGYQNVYLQPGGQVNAGCLRSYTDGAFDACGHPAYSVMDGSVASVDAAGGTVVARKSGFTVVSVTEAGRSATVNVWVGADPRVPHFTGSGEMSRGYVPGSSLFVIAPFFLDPDALSKDDSLRAEAVRAGVNTLGTGFYTNPRSLTTTFSDWQKGYDNTVTPRFRYARDHGFHLLVTGDDLARRIGGDAWHTLNWPSGSRAVAYAAGQLAASKVAIGIEGIDEASMLWGARPQPEGHVGQASYVFDSVSCRAGVCSVHWMNNPLANGAVFAIRGSKVAALNTPAGQLYAAQNATATGFTFQTDASVSGTFDATTDAGLEYLWFAGKYCAGNGVCNPNVGNDALATIRKWISGGAPSLAVTFPALSIHPVSVQQNWMGSGSISDYASHYFSSLKTRTTYPWSEGIQEMVSTVRQQFLDRAAVMNQDRPQLLLASLSGPSYAKGTAQGGVFQPGVDRLDAPGVSPEHVSALMMTAAALGAAGVRLYYFEPASDMASRAKAAAGAYFQTGANPTNLQTASWRAMGLAANVLTKVLEPYLLASALNSPAYGRNISTAAREGANGRMLLIVNGNDWERTLAVDFRPYVLDGGVFRYRVSATGIRTDIVAAQEGETIALAGGESVAYVFPHAGVAAPVADQEVPSDPALGEPLGVRYSYVYDQNLDRAPIAPCASPCTIPLDKALGEVTYRLIYAR